MHYVGVPTREKGQAIGSLVILQEIGVVSHNCISLGRLTQFGQMLANVAPNNHAEMAQYVDAINREVWIGTALIDQEARLVA